MVGLLSYQKLASGPLSTDRQSQEGWEGLACDVHPPSQVSRRRAQGHPQKPGAAAKGRGLSQTGSRERAWILALGSSEPTVGEEGVMSCPASRETQVPSGVDGISLGKEF